MTSNTIPELDYLNKDKDRRFIADLYWIQEAAIRINGDIGKCLKDL